MSVWWQAATEALLAVANIAAGSPAHRSASHTHSPPRIHHNASNRSQPALLALQTPSFTDHHCLGSRMATGRPCAVITNFRVLLHTRSPEGMALTLAVSKHKEIGLTLAILGAQALRAGERGGDEARVHATSLPRDSRSPPARRRIPS